MDNMYRGVNKGLHVLLSRTQAGPGRTVKQEQEEISRNHLQTFIYLSVETTPLESTVCVDSLRTRVERDFLMRWLWRIWTEAVRTPRERTTDCGLLVKKI